IGQMPEPELPDLTPSFTLPDPEPTGLAPLEANTDAVARWNTHDLAEWAKVLHSDAVFRYNTRGMVPLNRDQMVASGELFILSNSTLRGDIVRQVDLRDGWVLTEQIYRGVNDGPYFGIPASGNPTETRSVYIAHYDADGLITEMNFYFDNLTVLTQIGAFPPPTPIEAIRALARRGIEEIWNQKNLSAIDELIAPDYVQPLPAGMGEIAGPIGLKQFVASYLIAFPDINFEIHDIAVEGDLAAIRWTAHGSHLGPFMGIPPSGREGPGTTGITVTRFENGKQVESWAEWDALGLMGWLGVIPTEHELFQWGEPSPITGDPGDPEANKAVVMRFAEEVFNQKKLDVVDEIHHPGAIGHDPNVSPMEDIAQMKQVIGAYHIAFPDFHATNDALIAEGDMVVGRWTVTATHQGDFFGIPATGKPVQWTAINMFRFADGKIAESWWAYDALGILQQIGVVPTGPPEDFSRVFFLSLKSGLNMVSLPLKSITPYTARSFAEELSATVVIKLDETRQKFVGFTLDAPDDGFAIEGGKGYIVNVPEGRVVAFTGAAWTNQPPVEMAAPTVESDGAWAFVVSGRFLDDSNDNPKRDGYLVTVRNTRTNAVATDVVRKGYFAAAFADLNRRDVVQTGDGLELQVRNQAGEIISETLSYTVTTDAIRQALLPLTLKNIEIPRQSLLLQNYPNPFNPETWIPYQIREPAEVAIRIYNAQGQLVRTLDLGQRSAGFYLGRGRAAYWDGRNERGERVGSGVYFYHLRAGDFSSTRRMLVVK
ncbi:MAG: ester cyclase, partial [Candidatus Poribacteria bacterium]